MASSDRLFSLARYDCEPAQRRASRGDATDSRHFPSLRSVIRDATSPSRALAVRSSAIL